MVRWLTGRTCCPHCGTPLRRCSLTDRLLGHRHECEAGCAGTSVSTEEGPPMPEPEEQTTGARLLPCIICGKVLDPAVPDDIEVNQPYRGTVFTSHGHYGSTLFDDFHGREYLEITLCDPCLAAKAEHGRVLLYVVTRHRAAEYAVRTWRAEQPS